MKIKERTEKVVKGGRKWRKISLFRYILNIKAESGGGRKDPSPPALFSYVHYNWKCA